MAGAPLVKIPGEHQALSFGVALVPVELRQAAGEVFEGAAMVVADDREVDLGLQAGCGADCDAGALALDGQVVVLQERRVPVLVLVLIASVTLWGPGAGQFAFLLRALPQPCSLQSEKNQRDGGWGWREREREIKTVNGRGHLGTLLMSQTEEQIRNKNQPREGSLTSEQASKQTEVCQEQGHSGARVFC